MKNYAYSVFLLAALCIRDPFYLPDQPRQEQVQRAVSLVGIVQCDGKRRAIMHVDKKQKIIEQGGMICDMRVEDMSDNTVTLVGDDGCTVLRVGQEAS